MNREKRQKINKCILIHNKISIDIFFFGFFSFIESTESACGMRCVCGVGTPFVSEHFVITLSLMFFFHLLFLLFLFRTLFFEWLRWSSSIVSRSWRRCIECLFLSSPNWSLPWCCTIGGTDRSTTSMKITNKKMRSSTQFNVLLLTSPLQHSISHLYCNEIVMKIEYAFVLRTIYCEMCHWFYYQSVSSNALECIFVFIRGTQLTLLACGGGQWSAKCYIFNRLPFSSLPSAWCSTDRRPRTFYWTKWTSQ